MSYDLMVFHHVKAPHELGEMRQWFHTHMEEDVLPDNLPTRFSTFLQSIRKVFPPIEDCPEDRLDYACSYEIHEDFIYMGFGYSIAREAHDIVKRQAKMDNLGFWEVSQSFDRTFPITFPADKWPMLVEAKWIKYGQCFVYCGEEVRKIIAQMETVERSSVCLTDRYGNYMQAGGYKDAFIVEVREYVDAFTYRHMRADLKEEILDADTFVSINDWKIKVPESQVLSEDQVCFLFQKFTDGTKLEEMNIFWKKIEFE